MFPSIAVLVAKSPLTKDYDLSFIETLTCGASTLSKEIENELRQKFGIKLVKQG